MADPWNVAEPDDGSRGGQIDGERIKRELALFIGPKADRYLKDLKLTEKGRSTYQSSWHWPALFVPIPWFFYRKLYIHGAILLLVLILVGLLFPDFSGAGLGVALAMIVKSLYLEHGLKKLKNADARGLEGYERETYLQKAGGTSVPGAILGSAIMASAVALTLLAPGDGELLACDNRSVRQLAAAHAARFAMEAGASRDALSVDEFKELRTPDPDTARRCELTARAAGKTARVTFTILWEDEDRSQVRILMGRSKIRALFE